MKKCSSCKKVKTKIDFVKCICRKDGLSCYCRACGKIKSAAWRKLNPEKARMAVKHWELNNPEKVKDKSLARRGNQKIAMQIRQRKYGISIADFKELLETQNNLCAICAGRMIPICVDHDHLTNQVRGLLCRECNSAIGKLKDSPELLRNAIQYLEKAVADTNKQQPNE